MMLDVHIKIDKLPLKNKCDSQVEYMVLKHFPLGETLR